MKNLKIKIALCEKGKKNKEKENIEEKKFNY